MATTRDEVLNIQGSSDVVQVRQVVRTWATELGFSLVDQTKVVTAASELARNTLEHGRGGTMRLEMLNDGTRRGLRYTSSRLRKGRAGVTRSRAIRCSTGSSRS